MADEQNIEAEEGEELSSSWITHLFGLETVAVLFDMPRQLHDG